MELINEVDFQDTAQRVDALRDPKLTRYFSLECSLAVGGFNRRLAALTCAAPWLTQAAEIEKKLFLQSIHSIETKIDHKNKINRQELDTFIEEVQTSFFKDPQANELMEKALMDYVNQSPPSLGHESYFGEYDPRTFTDPYLVLRDPTAFGLDQAPFGQRVLSHAFDMAAQSKCYGRIAESVYFNEANADHYQQLLGDTMEACLDNPDPVAGLLDFAKLDEYAGFIIEKPEQKGAIARGINFRRIPFNKDTVESVETRGTLVQKVGPTVLKAKMFTAAATRPDDFLQSRGDLRNLPFWKEACYLAFDSLGTMGKIEYLSLIRDDGILTLGEVQNTAILLLQELIAGNPSRVFVHVPIFAKVLESERLLPYLQEAAVLQPSAVMNAWRLHDLKTLKGGEILVQQARWDLMKQDFKSLLTVYFYYDEKEFPSFSDQAAFEVEFQRRGLADYPDLLLDIPEYSALRKKAWWPALETRAKEKADEYKKKRQELADVLLAMIPDENLVEEGQNLGPRRRRDELLKDPALLPYPKVDLAWLPIQDHSTAIQTSVMILRNLYAEGTPFSQDAFVKAYARLQEVREKWGAMPLFAGRNVLLLSHEQTYKDLKDYDGKRPKDRFGLKELETALKGKIGSKGTFEHLEAQKNFDSVKKTKEKFMLDLISMPSPMTVVFDGHGWDRALYLSDGEVAGTSLNGPQLDPKETNETIKISVVELAQCFQKRQAAGKDTSKDLLILSSCESHVFAMNFYKELDKLSASKPVVLTSSEFGQYAFSSYDSRYGNDFFDAMLKVKEPSLGDYFHLDPVWQGNPSLFVPTQKNYMELAENAPTDRAVSA